MAPGHIVLTFTQSCNDPAQVLRVHDDVDAQGDVLPPGTARLTFLAAPINPQDLMAIAGRYPVKPAFFHAEEPIPGNDGVARVEAVGPSPTASPDEKITAAADAAHTVHPGDLVVPRRHGLGTWRRHAVLPVNALTPISSSGAAPVSSPLDGRMSGGGLDLVAAAMLKTVFVPAYLLVEDMVDLAPGDWVVQNAAASTIAQLATQFVRRKGAHVVSIVRDRPHHGDGAGGAIGEQQLPDVGPADVVLTESQVAASGVSAHPALEAAAAQGRVVLALDAVFGGSGELVAGLLSKGATFVNYGSLGGADGVLRLSQKLLFWNEVKFRNFRLTEQLGKRSAAEQEALLRWLADLVARGELKRPAVEKIVVPGDAASTAEFQNKVMQVLTAAAAREVGFRKHVFDFSGEETGCLMDECSFIAIN